jgi:hypothetical protein
MNIRHGCLFIFYLAYSYSLYGQNPETAAGTGTDLKNSEINGFVRGGMYIPLQRESAEDPYVSSIFSDFGLKLRAGNSISYKAVVDLRFRYGTEFGEPVNRFTAREGFVSLFGKKWDVSAGQQIIKWGRADFTNPTSKFNPQNYISRSPDREDMDLGNILISAGWYPSQFLSFKGVATPVYKPSVLLIGPIPLPANVTLNQSTAIIANQRMFTYGLKADIHLQSIDWSFSWFDGYDPMPGIALTSFALDMSAPVPVPSMQLTTNPYRIRMAGMDFEFAAGPFGIRGEAAYTRPYLAGEGYEYVPFPELRWVAGIDWSSGIWRLTAEYSGKYVLDYFISPVDPVIGSEADYSKLAELFQVPGFDPQDYIRQQVAAFNRLYNYQIEQYYHSAGLKAEADLLYGKLAPSIFTMYNLTSGDQLLIPEVKIKPADGLTVSLGGEIYKGRKGSLFDIVDGFMNSVYVCLRVDF